MILSLLEYFHDHMISEYVIPLKMQLRLYLFVI